MKPLDCLGLMFVVLLGCTIAREGSVVVNTSAPTTNTAAAVINAAANGANAQHADRHGTTEGKSSAMTKFASRWWLWVIIGAVAILAGWFVWKFGFTGARIALVGR